MPDMKEKFAQLDQAIQELKDQPGALMPVLQRAQNIFGCVSLDVQKRIAEGLGVTLSEVYGVATFYAQFSLVPSGKYVISVCLGTACYVKGSQKVLDRLSEELGIPVLTGMYEENPGADLKDKVLIVATTNNAAGMRKAAPTMAKLAMKLMKGEKLGASCEDGYMNNGIRVNFFEKERGSRRAVKMLLNKLADKPFTTEYPMPSFDRVAPNPAVKDLSHAVIALCTSGGIVPKGNPDHIESSSASHYGEYCIAGVENLTPDKYETAHGGYDPVYANEDPDRVLPVDVMREFEREGKIGKLYDYFYTTVGNGTAVANAKKFAAEYAQKLKQAGVNAVIMTST